MNLIKGTFIGAVASALMVGQALAVDVPVTDLTKSCKPLVNKNFKIPKPPLKGLKERVQKRLVRGMEYLADSNYVEAISTFKGLLESTEDSYARAVIYQNLAAAYSQQGQYDESLPYYEQALKYAEGNLPHERVQALRYNVAALFYQAGRANDAINLLKDWLKKSNVEDPKVFILLSVLNVQQNKYREALCPAYFAAKASKNPKKDYFNNLMAIHFELKDIKGTALLLKKMIEYFPNESVFWDQLAAIYTELDRYDDALIISDLQYILGQFEKEVQYKTLSSLYAYAEMPYQAAVILKEGIDKGIVKSEEGNWRNIAQNFQVANEIEKAIQAWKKTAELTDDGKAYERLAQLYNEKDRWRDTIDALNKALSKGDIDNPGLAYINKGIAQINLKECTQGIKTLRQASKYKAMRKQAVAWIGYAEDRMKKNKCR